MRSIWRRASWSATAGATSAPARRPVAARLHRLRLPRRRARPPRSSSSARWPKRSHSSSCSSVTVKDQEQCPIVQIAEDQDFRRRRRPQGMQEMYRQPLIKGFTTNPTLMRKAGVADYEAFARKVLAAIPDRPVSFEVFADDFAEMEQQALRDRLLGPATSTSRSRSPIRRGEFCGPLVQPPVAARRAAQRHGHHDARPGAAHRRRAGARRRRRSSRCSPAASPIPGVDPVPIMARGGAASSKRGRRPS